MWLRRIVIFLDQEQIPVDLLLAGMLTPSDGVPLAGYGGLVDAWASGQQPVAVRFTLSRGNVQL